MKPPLRATLLALALLPALLAGCRGPVAEEGSPLDAVLDRLEGLAAAEPSRASLRRIGLGASAAFPDGDPALPIESIRVVGASWKAGDPVVQVLGSMHGNEPLGAELCLSLAELALGPGDEKTPAALARVALDILPVANPRGFAEGSRYLYATDDPYVDPNRSFPMDYLPAAAGSTASGTLPSHPEIRALAGDAASERYAISISLHTGDYRICIPWDYIGTVDYGDTVGIGTGTPYAEGLGSYVNLYSPAHPWFVARGAAYAALVEAAAGEAPGSFPAVQGYDWYYAGGTYGDWLYLKLGTAPFTIELSGLQGGDSVLPEVVTAAKGAHLDALVVLVAAARLGLGGSVKDAVTKAAVAARVEARPAASSRAPSWTDPVEYLPFALAHEDGTFRIALQPGRWELSVSAPGYATATRAVAIGDSGSLEGVAISLASLTP